MKSQKANCVNSKYIKKEISAVTSNCIIIQEVFFFCFCCYKHAYLLIWWKHMSQLLRPLNCSIFYSTCPTIFPFAANEMRGCLNIAKHLRHTWNLTINKISVKTIFSFKILKTKRKLYLSLPSSIESKFISLPHCSALNIWGSGQISFRFFPTASFFSLLCTDSK